MADVIIDLGENGEILVESMDDTLRLSSDNSPTEKTGIVDTLRQAGGKIKVEAAGLLKLPLTGVAKMFLASLPETSVHEPYELDQFSVEFNLGIKTEAGSNAGAVVKISPEGSFKCTYTWKLKAKPVLSKPEQPTV
jgi:hypothetical protein